MVVIDGQHGLPPLLAADFRLIWSVTGKTPAADAFGHLLVEMSESSSI